GIARQLEHPGREGAATEGMAILEEADEDLLDQVLGSRPAARQAHEEAVEPVVMALEQESQAADVAVSDLGRELGVRRVVGGARGHALGGWVHAARFASS